MLKIIKLFLLFLLVIFVSNAIGAANRIAFYKSTFTGDTNDLIIYNAGAKWISESGDWQRFSWNTSTDTLIINVYDQMQFGSLVSGGHNYVYPSGPNPYTADYTVEVDMIEQSDQSTVGQLCSRMSTSAYTFYSIIYRQDYDNLRLAKWVAGSITILDTYSSFTPSAPSSFNLKLTVSGSATTVLKGYLDGTEILSYSDSSSPITAAGVAGLGLNQNGVTSGLTFDNFYAYYEEYPFEISEDDYTNPILEPSEVEEDFDDFSVRDMAYYKANDGTYNLVYTGFQYIVGIAAGGGIGRIGVATSSTHGGTYTKQGLLFNNIQFLYDTFTESSGNLNLHAPERGYREDWEDINGTLSISSNSVTVASGSSYGGICGRLATDGTEYYSAEYNLSNSKWELVKYASSTRTVLDDYAQTLTQDTAYNVKLYITDSAKKIYVDDVERCSDADNTITDVNKVGMVGGSATNLYYLVDAVKAEKASDRAVRSGEYSVISDFTKDVSGNINIDNLEAYNIGEEQSAEGTILYANGQWHYWDSCLYEDNATYGTIGFCHFLNDGAETSFPTSGWYVKDRLALIAKTTGWTSNGSGNRAGLVQAKLFKNSDDDTYFMFFCNWAANGTTYYAADYLAGYATADSLTDVLADNWTISDDPIVGEASGYQTETPYPFKYDNVDYILVNRIGLEGRTGNDMYHITTDLWMSTDDIFGPYELIGVDVLNMRGRDWGSYNVDDDALTLGTGVVAFYETNLNCGLLEGVYHDSDVGTVGASIGAFKITAPIIKGETYAPQVIIY